MEAIQEESQLAENHRSAAPSPVKVARAVIAEIQTDLDLHVPLDEASQHDLEQTRAALRRLEESQAATATLYRGALEVIAQRQTTTFDAEELRAERDRLASDNARLRSQAKERDNDLAYFQHTVQAAGIEATGQRGRILGLEDELTKVKKQLKQGLSQANATYARFEATHQENVRILKSELALAHDAFLRTESVRKLAASADQDRKLRMQAQQEMRNLAASHQVQLDFAADARREIFMEKERLEGEKRQLSAEKNRLVADLAVMTTRAEGAEARCDRLLQRPPSASPSSSSDSDSDNDAPAVAVQLTSPAVERRPAPTTNVDEMIDPNLNRSDVPAPDTDMAAIDTALPPAHGYMSQGRAWPPSWAEDDR